MGLKSDEIVALIKDKLAAADQDPAKRKVLAVFQINVTVDGKQVKQYVMNLKELTFSDGAAADADVTVTIDDEVWAAIGKNEMEPEAAKTQGKLKMEGNPEYIQKLVALVKTLRGK